MPASASAPPPPSQQSYQHMLPTWAIGGTLIVSRVVDQHTPVLVNADVCIHHSVAQPILSEEKKTVVSTQHGCLLCRLQKSMRSASCSVPLLRQSRLPSADQSLTFYEVSMALSYTISPHNLNPATLACSGLGSLVMYLRMLQLPLSGVSTVKAWPIHSALQRQLCLALHGRYIHHGKLFVGFCSRSCLHNRSSYRCLAAII